MLPWPQMTPRTFSNSTEMYVHDAVALVDSQVMTAAFENNTADDDGVESAFELQSEVDDAIRTAVWVGGCFIFTNAGETVTVFAVSVCS
jgi:hypothetical protein